MTNTHGGFIQEYRPPLIERFWRWAGFRHPYVRRPDETVEFPSYMVSRAVVNLSVADRLRVLISGRVCVETVHRVQTDPGEVLSISDAKVLPPGSPK
ncbi:MAG: hypothetical protein KGL39_51935 [Patescibacteria group bacterium]|nr:hypothetical protein [Patescibacteria group bacterium]